MKRALISVSDKTGLIEFAQGLVSCGYQIISTGGTKKVLDEASIPTIAIDEVTEFPEMLDGRVKTLHPKIHGGLLGLQDNPSHLDQMSTHHIEPIDLVCTNLYPFKETISKPNFTHEDAIENIDIGGPSMIRSAAKNHRFVTVVTDVKDYPYVLEEIKKSNEVSLATRQQLAAKAFQLTADYDATIQQYLSDKFLSDSKKLILSFDLKQSLRYGENPHQSAAFYADGLPTRYSMTSTKQLHGKELSYNNIQDGNAALQILKEFTDQPTVVALKHMNPCGVAVASDISTAYHRAYEADPVSIFGGIVAFNEEVNLDCAQAMNQLFLEIILAPSFSKEAFDLLSQKKNIRLMTFEKDGLDTSNRLTSVAGGLLVQQDDEICEEECHVTTITKPTLAQLSDAMIGMKIVKHVKSNAIVLVKDGQSVGIGAGQMNRVGAAKIALEQAQQKAHGATMASDAFFPMSDTVELASQFNVSCIIQPGGSIKDQESIDSCNNKNIAMIFTGKRHFKH